LIESKKSEKKKRKSIEKSPIRNSPRISLEEAKNKAATKIINSSKASTEDMLNKSNKKTKR
jgi:hypothetical protein